MEIVIKIEDAIWSLNNNKEQHLKDYELQLAAWKLDYMRYQDARDLWLSTTKIDMAKEPKAPFKPMNHAEDYDKLINKLNWIIGPTVQISDYEYGVIFEDEFNWKHSYINSSAISSASIAANKISAGTIMGSTIVEYAEQRLTELGYKKVSENE